MDLPRRTMLKLIPGLLSSLPIRAGAAPPDAIARRAIPGTKEEIPIIGLGTWQTFDVSSDQAARAPLREVLSAFSAGGGKLVDSSPMYGRSESVLGELAEELLIREKLFVATKVWTSGREAGIREMEQSMRRLRVPRLDLLQVHNLVDVGTHAKTLKEWKEAGRIRYMGITHYMASAYAEVERWLKTGAYDFLQINYSLAEREAERRLLPLALEKRVAVIINRPFAEGALFARVQGRPLPEWAGELGAKSWAQLFLKWIVGHPAVTCVIPASSKIAHVRDNLAAGTGPLPDAAQRQRLARLFD